MGFLPTVILTSELLYFYRILHFRQQSYVALVSPSSFVVFEVDADLANGSVVFDVVSMEGTECTRF